MDTRWKEIYDGKSIIFLVKLIVNNNKKTNSFTIMNNYS